MEIKNGVIMSPNFVQAAEKLLKVEMSVKDCVALSEAIDVINNKLSVLEKAKRAIMDRFAKKDENGEIVSQPAQHNENIRIPVFESDEAAQKFGEEISKMLEEVTDIPIDSKIKISGDVPMSTEDYRVIKDLIEIV